MTGDSIPVASLWTDLGALLPPTGAVLLLTALLTFAIREVRWLRLRSRARSPRVQISQFSWAAGESESEATWVTSLFRERLSDLRLDPLDPLPERAPGAPVVEIIEGVGQGLGHKFDLGAVLGRLYRAAWPDAAYEVWATLRPLREGGGRISVQLIDRAQGNQTVVSFVSDKGSWEESAAQAAMAVAGGLYPRVGDRFKGPWTRWNHGVPCELVELYHEARQHEADNRLEQALGAYHDALEMDPLNPHLRLKIAMLQERLGLDLDAWVTYNAIIEESDRDAWKGPDRKARILAQFRLAVLLCNGRIARKWTNRETDSEEKRARREELAMALKGDPLVTDGIPRLEYLQDHARFEHQLRGGSATTLLYALPGWDKARPPSRWIAGRFPVLLPEDGGGEEIKNGGRTETPSSRRVKEVIEIVALRRLEELDAWLRIRPPLHRFRIWLVHRPPARQLLGQRELSRAAIRLSKRLTRLRITASAEVRVDLDEADRDDSDLEVVRRAHLGLTRGWPFPGTRSWTPLVRWLRPRQRLADRREDSWQLHYNAACTAASTLRADSLLSRTRPLDEEENARAKREDILPAKTDRNTVVHAAMAELEEYAHRAGSSRVAEQAEWVALEDPDLAGLFEKDKFKLWAGHHLPWELPDERPSRDIDVNRVAAQMLQQGATAFAKSWQERAATRVADPEVVAAWWREERVAWRALRRVCVESRSWRERLDCIRVLEKCLAETEAAERIQFAHSPHDRHLKERVEEIKPALEEIAALIGEAGNGDGVKLGIDRWVEHRAEYVRSLHEEDSEDLWKWREEIKTERAEALRAARIWKALAESMERELSGENGVSCDFSPVIRRLLEEAPAPVAAGRV